MWGKLTAGPDTPANRGWLGKQKASNGETGSPALALMALVETRTRALIGAVFGPDADGETGQARGLLSLLDETMLALMDRGFDGGAFLAAGSNPPSRWNKHPDGKPRTSHRITGITAHVSADHQPATRRRKSVKNTDGPQLPGIGVSPGLVPDFPRQSGPPPVREHQNRSSNCRPW